MVEKCIESLRKRKLNLYLLGERIENWVDNPITRPSINAVAITYKLAHEPESKDMATTNSFLTGEKVNKFNAIYKNPEDMIKKIKFQRRLAYHRTVSQCARELSVTGWDVQTRRYLSVHLAGTML